MRKNYRNQIRDFSIFTWRSFRCLWKLELPYRNKGVLSYLNFLDISNNQKKEFFADTESGTREIRLRMQSRTPHNPGAGCHKPESFHHALPHATTMNNSFRKIERLISLVSTA